MPLLFRHRMFGGQSASVEHCNLPEADEVKVGVVYGPDGSSQTGTYVGGGNSNIDVDGFNQFDRNQIAALDSMYLYQGHPCSYNGVERRIMIESHRTELRESGTGGLGPGRLEEVELLTILVRRYGDQQIEQPAQGDTLELLNESGVAIKKYKLAMIPTEQPSRLEFVLLFSRRTRTGLGETRTRPVGA